MKMLKPLLLLLVWQLAQAQSDAPPAYPRDGASKMLENDHVIVWNISWLQRDYPVHRHRYDHTGVYYQPGDRIITSIEGEAREVHTDAWNISFQPAGVIHTETGISESPLQAVFIQIKRSIAGPLETPASIPQFPNADLLDRRSNDRVRVWEYPAGYSGSDEAVHFHAHDAVVVWFDAANQPNVYFVARGTVDSSDRPTVAERVFVFEIR